MGTQMGHAVGDAGDAGDAVGDAGRRRYRYEETQWRNAVEKRYGEPQLETQRGDTIAIAIAAGDAIAGLKLL